MVYSVTAHYLKGKLEGNIETIMVEGDSKFCILNSARDYFKRRNSNGSPYDNELSISWVKVEN